MNTGENEIRNTLRQENLPDSQIEGILADIRAGDQILKEHTPPRLPDPVRQRLEKNLPHLIAQAHSLQRLMWIRRVAAVILLALGAAAFWFVSPDRTRMEEPPLTAAVEEANPFESDFALMDLSLLAEDYSLAEADALVLSYTFEVWTTDVPSSEPIIGKEFNHETQICFVNGAVDCRA